MEPIRTDFKGYEGQYVAIDARTGEIVLAAFNHATGPLLGTICLSSLITLLVRLPLYILPGRLTSFFSACLYPVTPTPLLSATLLRHALARSEGGDAPPP